MSRYRFATQRQPRPWPVAPLARALGIHPQQTTALATTLGIDKRNIKRYRHWGLTTRQAEDWADRAGLHPAEIWPTYWLATALFGRALINAAKETCHQGHPLDRIDSAGRRRCTPCPAQAARRYRQSKKTQVTTVMTPQEAA